MGTARRIATPARLLTGVAALCPLVACGGSDSTTTACAPALSPAPAASATTGAVSLALDRGSAPRGGRVQATVTAAGPTHLAAPCAAPVALVVVDHSGLHVFTEAPAATTGVPCGDLILAAGQMATWRLTWEVDSTLPAGTYTVDVVAGDAADVSLPVVIGGPAPGLPSC